jgi:imidazolonepropionase-like amidohydrolase
MRVVRLTSALAVLATTGMSAQGGAGALVLTRANVIDGVAGQPLRDATVIVRDGKIERVATGRVEPPAGARVIDLGGRWVLPGLLDAHVHLRDLTMAKAALASGVTTARVLGVDHFADVGIRELNRGGATDVPDAVAAGYHVRPRPAEALFLDIPSLADLMGGVSGPQNVRRLVRALIDRGADVIKIMATERAGLPETDPRKRVFTEEELAAAVDEARKAGKFVAAHAHGDEGGAAAVRAGVRTIEHGTYLSDATLALMKERGTCLVPTIATVVDLVEPGGDYDDPALSVRGRAMLPRVREATAHAWKLGVKVIAGTDTDYGRQSTRRIPDEVAELVGAGMPALDAIKGATSTAAECIGVGRRTGAVRAGLEADLIVVERDPLADVSALRDVRVVINNGKVAIDRLSY